LPSDRITHGNKVYDVLSIIDKGIGNIQSELMCKSAGQGHKKHWGVCAGVFVEKHCGFS
jgi:hypothetical protein